MPVMSAIEAAFCRSMPWRSFARRRVLPWVLNEHSLQGAILEIGGGSGAMAAGVARQFPHARLTVTDLDAAMVQSARLRLASYPNVSVQVADVTAMPFEPRAFEFVTSYLMLHHVIDWKPALAEIFRVLRPGGVFLGYDLTDTRLARLLHQVDGSPHSIIAADELSHGLSVAGFSEVYVGHAVAGHLMRFHARKPDGV